ncbi:CHAD domain-containing protein [Streptomyces sp. WAC 00631]|nr:CHAD domain-containing protein [Streptomyces sp. WAC 00631]MCC5032725.1 CHAD domain-containing protein [Streptomyces sp. WAC 00631]
MITTGRGPAGGGLPGHGLTGHGLTDRTAGEVLAAYLHAQAAEFLRSLRLHRESGSDAEEAVEALLQMRRSARRIGGALHTYRALTDTGWADPLSAELTWLSTTLAREHGYAERLERLRGALQRLSGGAQGTGAGTAPYRPGARSRGRIRARVPERRAARPGRAVVRAPRGRTPPVRRTRAPRLRAPRPPGRAGPAGSPSRPTATARGPGARTEAGPSTAADRAPGRKRRRRAPERPAGTTRPRPSSDRSAEAATVVAPVAAPHPPAPPPGARSPWAPPAPGRCWNGS